MRLRTYFESHVHRREVIGVDRNGGAAFRPTAVLGCIIAGDDGGVHSRSLHRDVWFSTRDDHLLPKNPSTNTANFPLKLQQHFATIDEKGEEIIPCVSCCLTSGFRLPPRGRVLQRGPNRSLAICFLGLGCLTCFEVLAEELEGSPHMFGGFFFF